MEVKLTRIQRQLCNSLQRGLPACTRPFAAIGKALGSSEDEVLHLTSELKAAGVIRRIRALLSYRTLGRTSTLITGHVPPEKLKESAEAVNSLGGVSHNYLRSHHYNLWFTLQAGSEAEISVILTDLAGRLGVEFHSLPVVRVFKLDVRFDAESEGQALLEDVEAIPRQEPVKLTAEEERVLAGLAGELEVEARTFAFLCRKGHEEKDVLRVIEGLIDKGVIRRIAAVVDHRKLGFAANVLFAGQVDAERVESAGRRLARFGIVSHCYERRTFAGWPYNLFGMMHGRSMGQIQHAVRRFVEPEGIEAFELLATEAELKKQPVRFRGTRTQDEGRG
jgi:DNA-binding Lrp family transcriptional regulator